MFLSNNRGALDKYLLPNQDDDNYSGYYVFSKKKYLDTQLLELLITTKSIKAKFI